MTEQRKPVAAQIFGGNKAPIEEVLEADFADLRQTVEDMLARFADAPAEVRGDDDMIAIGTIISDARAVVKELETTRTKEGGPLFEAKKTIDAFFKDLIGQIDTAEKRVRDRADAYTRKKQAEEREIARRKAEEARRAEQEARDRAEAAKSAEAGGRAAARAEALAAQADAETKAADQASVKVKGDGVTASTRARWTFSIADYDAVDLNAIAPFMSEDCINKAVGAMVRAQKGRAKIPGVHVYQETTTTFRK